MTRVRLKAKHTGKHRTGVLLRVNREGMWIVLRDGCKIALPFYPTMWEPVE